MIDYDPRAESLAERRSGGGFISHLLLALALVAVVCVFAFFSHDYVSSDDVELMKQEMRDEHIADLALARDEGYDTGYSDGYAEALSDNDLKDTREELVSAYRSGYDDGKAGGYDAGYDNGYDVGYDAGYRQGYELGYSSRTDEAYSAGYKDGSYNAAAAAPSRAFYMPLWLFVAFCVLLAFVFVAFALEHRRCTVARREEDAARIELIRYKTK